MKYDMYGLGSLINDPQDINDHFTSSNPSRVDLYYHLINVWKHEVLYIVTVEDMIMIEK